MTPRRAAWAAILFLGIVALALPLLRTADDAAEEPAGQAFVPSASHEVLVEEDPHGPPCVEAAETRPCLADPRVLP